MSLTAIAAQVVIMITNPAGAPLIGGYPPSVYQPHLEPGQRQAVVYVDTQQCQARVRQLQQQAHQQAANPQLMPEHRQVLLARASSLQCLPAGSVPPARPKYAAVQPGYVWRIGRLNHYGWFEGQSLDMRYFQSANDCHNAYAQVLVQQQNALLASGQQHQQVLQWSKQFQNSYKCMPVSLTPAQPYVPYR